ncbi:MAG: choline-sulfatase [Verrucomicrobiales bacterium]|jgi:choline-sulfatase
MSFRFRLSALFLSIAAVASAVAEQPNILFILTDDQAPHAVRAAGDERFITPNIDRIFNEGAHLTNAFVATPVCSPSRIELITSRYGTEMGITDYINRAEADVGIPEDATAWPALLSNAGYRTALIGKWHLGVQDRHHPTKFGYDYFMGMRTGGSPPKDPVLEGPDGEERKFEGYTCDILTDHAIEFIRHESDAPFLVSLHFRAPHAAWLPVRPEDWEPFADLDPKIPNPDFPNLDVPLVKKRTREYLAAVKSIDRNVGRLLALLDEMKIADNTVVVFTSDHGYNLGEHGVWYKGNAIRILTDNPPQKWDNIPANRRPNMWDTSIRVPAAVRWPAVIPPGIRIEQTVSNLDWFPTLLAISGAQKPADLVIRGRDFSPLLRGEQIEWADDFYAEYSMKHGATTHMRMLRTPRWKFMRDFANPGRDELYDLTADPDETTNLADSNDERLVAIRQQQLEKILDRMRETGDSANSENCPEN